MTGNSSAWPRPGATFRHWGFCGCWLGLLVAALLPQTGATSSVGALYSASSVSPPPLLREFRGAWVASVANINWPSKPGLSTAEQKAELLAILNRAAALRINAILLQVRPACDALYSSKLEPWSEYLTGTQGQAPMPPWDPLAFAVAEAHARGLELHAWLNPYRARHSSAKSPLAATHVSRTRPEIVRTYGKQLWLDPGDPRTMDYSLAVVLDIVRRYDVDAIHFDDYFYPYREKGADGQVLDFPDDDSWRRHGERTGLTREDWRRQNVNTFLQRVNASIKAEKPWVRFGLSPFGIWRPGNPATVKGFDAYSEIYADSRRWLASGWCDYFAPQLYWPIAPPEQSFTALYAWWQQQNPQSRHIWPGLNSSKVGVAWKPAEIQNQILATRRATLAPGHIHWNLGALKTNVNGLAPALLAGPYQSPAVPPAFPWLGNDRLTRPKLSVSAQTDTVRATWSVASGGSNVRLWSVQFRAGGNWQTRLLPGGTTTTTLPGQPSHVAVTAVDRYGNASPTVTLERGKAG